MGRTPLKLGGERKYNIQTLWPLHKEITRRIMLGQKNVDIAADLGISAPVVSYAKNSALGRARMEELEAARDADTISVAKTIKQFAPIAIGVIGAMLEDTDLPAGLRFKVAQDVLDRAGHGAPTKVQVEQNHRLVTSEDLEKIKARARAAGAIVDVPSERVAASQTPTETLV